MHCANCQTEVPDGSSFCPACNAPFAYPPTEYYAQPADKPKAHVPLWAYVLIVLAAALLVIVVLYLVGPAINENDPTPTWGIINSL
jgi:hypothetical protein